MLKKIDDKRYKGILSVLEEELINLAEKKCATDWLKVGRYKLSYGMENILSSKQYKSINNFFISVSILPMGLYYNSQTLEILSPHPLKYYLDGLLSLASL